MDSKTKTSDPDDWSSYLFYSLSFIGTVVAIIMAGSAEQGGFGFFLILLGVAFLICPVKSKIDARLWWLAGGFLLSCGLSLMPLKILTKQAWRQNFVGLPIDLGNLVTPTPRETLFWYLIAWMAVVALLFCLTQPLRFKTLLELACAGSLTCAAYAGLAIFSLKTGWKFPYDIDPSFGFFPNRNHTAGFLVTGCMLSLGVLGVTHQQRTWLAGSLSAGSLAICVTALMVYSGSRAGILFMLAGTLLWVLGLGRGRWSWPLLMSFTGIVAAGLILFAVSKGEARNRIFSQITKIGELQSLPASSPPEQKMTLDGRVNIFKDTWKMVLDAPLTGVGLGAYQYVYHQYRDFSLSEMTSIHPESDWLMLASEAGLPSVIIAMTLALTLLNRVRSQRHHAYWPLRWGILCAVLTGLAHGIVDVPIHRIALGWWILLLAGAGLQLWSVVEAKTGIKTKLFFWLTGAGSIVLGFYMVRAEWFGGDSMPPFASENREAKISEFYDQKEYEKVLELSISSISQLPMAHNLYYLKGVAQYNLKQPDLEVDRSFKAERVLNPDWPEVPIRQGLIWIDTDTARAAAIWMDALDRALKIDHANGGGQNRQMSLYADLLRQAEKYPDMERRMYGAASGNPTMILIWLRTVMPSLTAEKLPKLSQDDAFLRGLSSLERKNFLQVWYEKGDRVALGEFVAQHLDWAVAFWPVKIRLMVDAKNFQQAVTKVLEHNHVELSLPPPGGVKNLPLPEDGEDVVVNFDYYWKVGNEITARRLIEEARTKAEKSGKPFPEIWKKSTALAIRDGQWEKAWSCLQRYLRESGLDTSL